MGAERLVVPAMTAVQSSKLQTMFKSLDKLIRDGKFDEASARFDDVLGLDRQRCIDAHLVFRKRRLGRSKKGTPTPGAGCALSIIDARPTPTGD